MKFTKWHGLGNDFILVDGRPDRWPAGRLADLARRACDRHFGVGGDGLIFIFKDDRGTLSMRILNADGSEAEMCGNGLRCVAKYAYLNGLVDRLIFDVNTGAGVLVPQVIVDGNRVVAVKVDMGEPVLERDRIPVLGTPGMRMIEEEILAGDEQVIATAVSMGNPHCLVFVPDVSRAPVCSLGPVWKGMIFFRSIPMSSLSRSGAALRLRCGSGSGGSGRPWPAAPAPVLRRSVPC